MGWWLLCGTESLQLPLSLLTQNYVRNTQKETWPTRKAPSAPLLLPTPNPGPNHQHLLTLSWPFEITGLLPAYLPPFLFFFLLFFNLSFLPSCPSPSLSFLLSVPLFFLSSLLPSLPLSLSFSPSLPPSFLSFLEKSINLIR